jgi:type IV secretory pathway VirD2 relaxase
MAGFWVFVDRHLGVPTMAYGNQDQGDRGSRSEPVFTLQERLSQRLASPGAEAQARLPTRLKGDGGSVRASLARKLVHAKLFGRGSGGTAGGGIDSSDPAARKGGVGSISVRASQRVVVKAFVARHKGPRAVANPSKAIVQHVKYLAREGVGFDGSEAHFYGPAGELAPEAVKEATRAWGDDRHHFRLIISPEQADKMEDLQGYIRNVMGEVSRDLKEPALTWVAINHHDTDQPHAHVLIRGIRANGSTLIIPREIISQGIRQRAENHAQSLLGDKTRTEAEQQLFGRTRANYWTDIDRKLTKLAEANSGLLASEELTRTDTFGAVARGRVTHLERMGLVTRSKAGVAFAPDMKQRLDTLQRSKDEIRSYWDRERSAAFSQRGAPEHSVSKESEAAPSSQRKVEARRAVELERRFDPTTDRLTPHDVILARRANGRDAPEPVSEAMEAELRARAEHLIKAGHGTAQGRGIGFKAESWYALRDNDFKAAAREQLGLERGSIGVQPSASEGTVLGHIDTALGRHAVIDRGVNIIAVREMPGAELALGLVLGAGIGR